MGYGIIMVPKQPKVLLDSTHCIYLRNVLLQIYLIFILLMGSIRVLHIFRGNLIILISLHFSVYWGGKRMFPVTQFNMLSVLNIFWLQDVSHHNIFVSWRLCLVLHMCSQVVQKAISVGIPNSEFLLETHRFIKKWQLGLSLELSPLTAPKQLLPQLSEWSYACYFHNIHLRDHVLLKFWLERGEHH